MTDIEIVYARPLYTVRTAAERLATSERRIRDLVRTGKLRSIRDGQQLKFTPEAMDEYIAGLEDGGAAA